MNSGRTVFSQLMDYFPRYEFRQCVARYNGNYRAKSFSCLDQFICMAFAQLTFRESLRDIECCLRAMKEKLYHMGMRARISRSTLADANEKRDWRIYGDFAQVLIQTARQLYADEDLGVDLDTDDSGSADIDLDMDAALDLDTDDGVSLDMDADIDLAADDVSLNLADEAVTSLGDDDDDFDISELSEDVDEVSTKLDLAKAYLDMGDADGTRSILGEVMTEGNDDQKKEAEELMQQLG